MRKAPGTQVTGALKGERGMSPVATSTGRNADPVIVTGR